MKIVIFWENEEWKIEIRPHTLASLLMHGWTTNQFASNYKNCNFWEKRRKNQIEFKLCTLDQSVNMLTNNLLAIFKKKKKLYTLHAPARLLTMIIVPKRCYINIVSPNEQTSTQQTPQLPNLLCLPFPISNYSKVHKDEGSLNRKGYSTCSQRIWDKCDYMLKLCALIYYYLDFLKINTYNN